MKYLRIKKYRLLLSFFIIVFIAFGLVGGCDGGRGGGDDPFASADLVRGGLLYDRWWVVTGALEPEGTNPTYPSDKNAEVSEPPRSGSQTYRCKECHGWDYLGAEGAYAKPNSHYTGIEGVLEVSEGVAQMRTSDHSPEEIFMILANGIPGEMLPWIDFMSEEDLWDLTKFLKEGLIDLRNYIDYSSPGKNVISVPVDLGNGGDIFVEVCLICHGPDGEGTEEFDTEGVSLHEIAIENPQEWVHKARIGQPGTLMPSLVALGYSTQDVIDLLAYAQEVLPNPPVIEEGCCVIAEADCLDGITQTQCDGFGGSLEVGAICSEIEICGGGPISDGEQLYFSAENQCSVCHGDDAMGSVLAPGSIIGATSEQIEAAIMGGSPLMAFLDFLTPEEIDALAEYLQSLE